MAEFVEVMRIAKRICDEYANGCLCNGCPINGNSGCIFFDSMDCDNDYYPKIDKIVCDWAKDHPEPMYPSWNEGWNQLFPYGEVQCPNDLFDAHVSCNVGCTQCKTRPMLPHIAEKLGIKPKENT